MMKVYVVFAVLAVAAMFYGTWGAAEIAKKEFSTDWTCMQLCQEKGMMWSYCKKLCSY